MKIHQTDFSTGKVSRNIMEIALPMMLGQILNLLYNIVDRIYLGHIPEIGETALTGVGVCFPIITLITAFTYLFGNGGSPLFAMERGKGNEDEAGRLMGNTFSMLLIFAAILTATGFIIYKPVLYLFGASDVTFPYASSYLRVYLIGTVFVMITLGLNPFINAQGFGSIGMMTTVIGCLINIGLDPIFIYVFGLNSMGAALATIISQGVSAFWVLWFLTRGKAIIKLKLSAMKIKWERIKRIMGLGMAGFFMSFTNSLVQVACNMTLQTWGGDLYVSIMTVLNSIREIFTMPVMGIANGAQPVMSFNYGAKTYDRVKKGIRFLAIVCTSYTVIAWIVISLFPGVFIRIFNDSPGLLSSGVHATHLYFFGFCFMALQFVAQATFVSLGKAKRAVFFSLLRKAFIVVPLTFILPHIAGLGVDGVFIAEPISNVAGGLASFITMMLTVMPELNGKPRIKKQKKNTADT